MHWSFARFILVFRKNNMISVGRRFAWERKREHSPYHGEDIELSPMSIKNDVHCKCSHTHASCARTFTVVTWRSTIPVGQGMRLDRWKIIVCWRSYLSHRLSYLHISVSLQLPSIVDEECTWPYFVFVRQYITHLALRCRPLSFALFACEWRSGRAYVYGTWIWRLLMVWSEMVYQLEIHLVKEYLSSYHHSHICQNML